MDAAAHGVTTHEASERLQNRGLQLKPLCAEDASRLARDRHPLSPFRQTRLEEDAQRNWDLFYKRNNTHFFKDRHWTRKEFADLRACEQATGQRLVVLEAGCGVGNCLFPLLEEERDVFVYACDFSPRAISFVKENPLYDEGRCFAFRCDLTSEALTTNIPMATIHVATLIFVLSSVHPEKMLNVLHNIFQVLHPDGKLLFRDYGMYDHAMMRFKPGRKLSENFYVRQDGTRAFFFSRELVAQLFNDAGFLEVSNEYVFGKTVNPKEGLEADRVFVQGTYQRPASGVVAQLKASQ
uniref:tRNA N(3)-cytidine methyltransferase n=1 Tax=Eptatretus burgeri TaxID=7764 RepID=A0A8C4Q4E4_EPTBU